MVDGIESVPLIQKKSLLPFRSFFFSHSFSHFSNCVNSAMVFPETVLFVMEKFNFSEVQVNSGVHARTMSSYIGR